MVEKGWEYSTKQAEATGFGAGLDVGVKGGGSDFMLWLCDWRSFTQQNAERKHSEGEGVRGRQLGTCGTPV